MAKGFIDLAHLGFCFLLLTVAGFRGVDLTILQRDQKFLMPCHHPHKLVEPENESLVQPIPARVAQGQSETAIDLAVTRIDILRLKRKHPITPALIKVELIDALPPRGNDSAASPPAGDLSSIHLWNPYCLRSQRRNQPRDQKRLNRQSAPSSKGIRKI
nr:hypothetical protein [Ruegeria arenilitoris]